MRDERRNCFFFPDRHWYWGSAGVGCLKLGRVNLKLGRVAPAAGEFGHYARNLAKPPSGAKNGGARCCQYMRYAGG